MAAIIEQWKPARLLVTSRIRSYTGTAVLPFRTIFVAPFDQEKIKNFALGWYHAQQILGRISPQLEEERAGDLARAATSDDMIEISSNPMMLTSMAIIHQKEIGLPKERVRLYKLVVDVLLLRWQKYKTGDDSLAAFLKDYLRLQTTLERLAYEAHRAGTEKNQAGDLPRGALLVLLEDAAYLGSLELAVQFLDYIDQRAGLLVGRGGAEGQPSSYSFPHRTFQEYLVGCYLAGQRDLTRAFFQHAAEGDTWDLAAQLACEEMYFNRRGQNSVLDLVYALCPETCKPEPAQSAQIERARLWAGQAAALVGQAAIEQDTQPGGGQPFLERLRPGLVQVLSGVLAPLERVEAGRSLARLGDPRLEVLTWAQMQFCFVPGGMFWMGEGKEHHQVDLPDYWISRYPVSQALFAEFVQAGGYNGQRYWGEAIKEKRWDKKGYRGYDGTPRQNPENYGEPFDLPNHPVVGVSWYEALAFTYWLGEQLQRQVRLPSEAEWEKAARGGLMVPAETLLRSARQGFEAPAQAMQSNPAPQRVYPWGDRVDPNRANYDETGIGATSAVGCFPGGASPYGCLDMSGNVWELTLSQYGKYPYQPEDSREELTGGNSRVVRGGSFFNVSRRVRCAYRSGDLPVNFFRLLGFRVCLPHSPQA